MVELSYKDIQFILLALEDYKKNKCTAMSWHTDEDLISEMGNDYLFVESLINKLTDYRNNKMWKSKTIKIKTENNQEWAEKIKEVIELSKDDPEKRYSVSKPYEPGSHPYEPIEATISNGLVNIGMF